MPHQCPGSTELPVKLDGPHEVECAHLVVSSQTVVVRNDAARLRPVLVILVEVKGKGGQFPVLVLDVEQIGVQIKALEAEGVLLEQLSEPVQGVVSLLGDLEEGGDLAHEEDAVGEVLDELVRDVEGVLALLSIKQVAGEVEVLDPVVPQLVQELDLGLPDQGRQLEPRRPQQGHFVEGLDEDVTGLASIVLLLKEHAQHVEVDRVQLALLPQLA
mmetsp:Transcript_15141/g.25664  ORF Transcript_15141/g.25664 Transcript_15141/m.25664 type:complete len:215 (-) Transcript_15141:559-1203(-)